MKPSLIASLAVAALLLMMGSFYVVNEGQTAMVLNLGRVVRSDIGPGLHFKAPLIESVRVFDRRLQVQAQAQRERIYDDPARRGEIIDRSGNQLAYTMQARSLTVSPVMLRKELREQQQVEG